MKQTYIWYRIFSASTNMRRDASKPTDRTIKRRELQYAVSKMTLISNCTVLFNIQQRCLESEDWLRTNESIILQLGKTSEIHQSHITYRRWDKQASTTHTPWKEKKPGNVEGIKIVSELEVFPPLNRWPKPCDERTVLHFIMESELTIIFLSVSFI